MTTTKEARVEILSDMVGQYPKGTVIPASVFGLELPRLMEVGAVGETDKEVSIDIITPE